MKMEEIKEVKKSKKKTVAKAMFRNTEQTWLIALIGNQTDKHIRENIPSDSKTVTEALWEQGYTKEQVNIKKTSAGQAYLRTQGYYKAIQPNTRVTYAFPEEA